jgi:hypothetical protein
VRLLSLDYVPVYGKETTLDRFDSDTSVFDYDVVIWDPAESMRHYLPDRGIALGLGHYSSSGYYRGLPSLSDDSSVRIEADVERRNSEFVEFIEMGRVVVVVVRPPQKCYIDTGRREHSGTGRNRRTTRIVDQFDLLSTIPSDAEFFAMGGSQIDFVGDGSIVQLLRKYKQYLTYEAVISNPPGVALARIAGTSKVVGSILRSEGGGYLILLPAPDFRAEQAEDENEDESEDANDEDIWLPEAETFEEDLLAAIEQLNGSASLSRPAWAERYATDEQQRLQGEVVKQQRRVETARAKLAALQRQREEVDAKDQLFLGTGRALELEVRQVLQLLGGTVTEPPPSHDDWRVSFPEGDAVVEVKGVSNSAAQKHATQLEKWVSSIYDETERLYKGILIVNTWRELPLDERTDADFPEQMVPYSERRGHCLVTGLQLFVIQAEVEKDPSRVEHWRKQLLETVGQLVGADDWRSIIHEVRTAD